MNLIVMICFTIVLISSMFLLALTIFLVKELRRSDAAITKYGCFFRIFNIWLSCKRQDDLFVEKFFLNKGYHEIAVYGYGYLGRQLVSELNESKIRINYVIDRFADKNSISYPCFTSMEQLPQADVIVVSVIEDYYDIKQEITQKCRIPVISIEDII